MISASPETLFKTVHDGLLKRPDLDATFLVDLYINPRTTDVTETVRFFVAPTDRVLPLERNAFRAVFDSLELAERPEGTTILRCDSGWHETNLPENQGLGQAFGFGSLTYGEPINHLDELLESRAYLGLREQAREELGAMDTIGRFLLSGRRNITFMVFTDPIYARLMTIYQMGLKGGWPTEQTLDFLTHDITSDQYRDLNPENNWEWFYLRRHFIDKGFSSPNGLMAQLGNFGLRLTR